MRRIIQNGEELYHYGKLGMKWGHHKSNLSTSQKKAERKEFRKEYRQAYKDQFQHPIHSLAAQGKLIKEHPLKALNMDLKTVKGLNADVKSRVDKRQNEIKTNVKNYKKEYDKASNMSDKADEQWKTAREAYKKTGKNRAMAIINNIKGKSPEVQAYRKAYDKASNMSDRADEQWHKTQEAYKKTGRNRIGAIINNFKY